MKTIKNVVVVGLGYVGLPLALLASDKGYTVTGLDTNDEKIGSLREAHSYIDDVSDQELHDTAAQFTTNTSVVSDADIIIICVPTPLKADSILPDLSPIKGAVRSIAPHLKPQALIVLESTVNPGVCDDDVIPLLEAESGKKVGSDIFLAYCPERINPGDATWNVRNIPRVIGANSAVELELAQHFYESIIEAPIKPMQSLKEAEAVKVVENSFRDINIAFVNELAMSFHKLGIDLKNVIDGAATKPFSFMAHYPGCGVGGHCIPIDPYYLIDYASNQGFEHDFLRMARRINESMPAFTVDMLEEGLGEINQPLKGTKVALLGLSYKANVGDDRSSPAHQIAKILAERGAQVETYDPFVLASSSLQTLSEALEYADAIVIATGHREFRDKLTPKLLQSSGITVVTDGRNMFHDTRQTFAEHGIVYKGIGL